MGSSTFRHLGLFVLHTLAFVLVVKLSNARNQMQHGLRPAGRQCPPQRQRNSYLDMLTAHTLSSSEKASLGTSGLCLLLCNSSQGFLSSQLWALKLRVTTLKGTVPEAPKRPVLESWPYLLAGWLEPSSLSSLSFRGTILESRDETPFRGSSKGRRDRGDARRVRFHPWPQ